MRFPFFACIFYIFSRILCYGGLIKTVRLPFLLLRPEVVFIGTGIGFLPLTQFIYLAIYEGFLVCRLS